MIARWLILGAASLPLPIVLLANAAASQPATPSARSVALFVRMAKVITSPRCMNCHPRSDRPNQTDAGTPHNPPVTRGRDGHGVPGLECSTCHGDANVDFANATGSIPGNPKWHLAPIAMAWEGKSIGAICRQIKDPKRNGGKTLAQLVAHNRDDALVGWAWHPGTGRTPAPGTQTEFGALTQAWVESGAKCPT